MRRVLLVTHRPIQSAGGPAARWRSFVNYLPQNGWEVDVVAPSGRSQREFGASTQEIRRAMLRRRVMSRAGKAAEPLFACVGLRPEAMPPSMGWIPRATLEIRRQIRTGRYSVVVATGPPMAALVAARLASSDETTPLVVELRDLWAGNPAVDRGSRALAHVESWVLSRADAIVALTPEAIEDLRRRHPALGDRIVEIPNGFEPELLALRRDEHLQPSRPVTILHSGTLTPDRPITPLLHALDSEPKRSAFRLVFHGYVDPVIREELNEVEASIDVEVRAPSDWKEAVETIAAADVGLISQSRHAGDETAVAAKVYEYLALGKPVLCLTDGGATEALLGRLGAGEFCARLDDQSSITNALDRLRAGPFPPALPPERLCDYKRNLLAKRMAATLDRVIDASESRVA